MRASIGRAAGALTKPCPRPGILSGVPLHLNLAALTEAELLTLYGQEAMQARLPDLARARLEWRRQRALARVQAHLLEQATRQLEALAGDRQSAGQPG